MIQHANMALLMMQYRKIYLKNTSYLECLNWERLFKFMIINIITIIEEEHMCRDIHVKDRGQLCGVGSLLSPLCELWGSEALGQICVASSLSIEPLL